MILSCFLTVSACGVERAMEQTQQGAGQQQNRQQPVYDIRNGGHYGLLSLLFLVEDPDSWRLMSLNKSQDYE